MLLSAFTPFGLHQLSGKEPLARRLYDSMKAQVGDQLSTDVGTRQEAFIFATSLAIARAAKKQEEGALQGLIDRTSELLPVFEEQYGINPGFSETTSARKEELRLAAKRPTGWSYVAIQAVLQDMLGAGLITYFTTPTAEVVRYPTAIGNQPMNLQRADVPRKIVRLLDPVSFTGVQVAVRYELVDVPVNPVAGGSLDVVGGDVFVVEPNVYGIGESVTIASASTVAGVKTLRATFTKAHSVGALAFTHPYPSWISTRRHHLVVVTPAVAQDPIQRARIDRQMRKMVRASSTWSIVQSSDGLELDVFEHGSPSVSNTSLSAFTL
jgi:hypothetical protein